MVIEIKLDHFIKEVLPLLLQAEPADEVTLGEIEIAAVRLLLIWREEYHFDDVFAEAVFSFVALGLLLKFPDQPEL